MGDSGSLFLGFTVASLTLSPEGIRASRTDVLSVIAGPVFLLLIPIFDTTLVTVSRLLSGRSPAVGGRDHSSHRLVAMGLSERAAVFVLWVLAAVGGVIGLTLRNATEGLSFLPAAVFLAGMAGSPSTWRGSVSTTTKHVPAREAVTPLIGDFMYKRRVVEVLVDFCVIGAAYYAAYRLRFTGDSTISRTSKTFYESLPVVLAVAAGVVLRGRRLPRDLAPLRLARVKDHHEGRAARYRRRPAGVVVPLQLHDGVSRGAFVIYFVLTSALWRPWCGPRSGSSADFARHDRAAQRRGDLRCRRPRGHGRAGTARPPAARASSWSGSSTTTRPSRGSGWTTIPCWATTRRSRR